MIQKNGAAKKCFGSSYYFDPTLEAVGKVKLFLPYFLFFEHCRQPHVCLFHTDMSINTKVMFVVY